jgi:hypothetical protein
MTYFLALPRLVAGLAGGSSAGGTLRGRPTLAFKSASRVSGGYNNSGFTGLNPLLDSHSSTAWRFLLVNSASWEAVYPLITVGSITLLSVKNWKNNMRISQKIVDKM